MPRLQLRLYTEPGEAQIFCNLLRQDGNEEKLTATIDTGAAISLFPRELLDEVVHRPSEYPNVTIGQAGIAAQSFKAFEAYVTISLEDESGHITKPFEIIAWFANTRRRLIGFKNILDSGILHLDLPNRAGWLEIDA
jgi:hypothetical protein